MMATHTDNAPNNRIGLSSARIPINTNAVPKIAPPKANIPILNKMMEPAVLSGPAQGPPPIASNPTGVASIDNQHAWTPTLNRLPIFSPAIFRTAENRPILI